MKRGQLRRCLRGVFTRKGLLLLLVPPTLLFAWIYAMGVASAARLSHFDDWWSRPKAVRHHVGHQLRALINTPEALVLERRLDPEANAAGTLRLEVPRQVWDEIRRDPQALFGVDIKGRVLRSRGLLPVDLRVRGDTSVHWTTEKISFTLRTAKQRDLKGHQRLAFSGKEVLNQHLAARLAEEFDLLGPRSSLADVFLHDRFYGIYRAIEIPDESFLRRRNLLPGEVFRGDTAERGEVYSNVPRWLFLNPAIWERSASGGLGKREARAEISKLLLALHDEIPESNGSLLRFFDPDEIGRLVAYLLVVGDPYHQTDIHNQYWYRDPATGFWRPVPWDVFVRDLGPGYGESINELLRNLVSIPRVWDVCLQTLRKVIDDGRILTRTDALLAAAERDHGSALAYDRLRGGAISHVGRSEVLSRVIRSNLAKVERLLETSDALFGTGRPSRDQIVLDVESRGAGCRLAGLRFRASKGIEKGRLRLALDADGDGQLDPEERERARVLESRAKGGALEARLKTPLLLPVGATALKGVPRSEPRAYRLFVLLEGEWAKDPELELTPLLLPRFEEEPLAAKRRAKGAILRSRPAPFAVPGPTKHRRIDRDLLLEETQVIPAGTTLEIARGVTLSLGADVSLIIEGRLVADGVVIRPAKARTPWGSLVLRGDGARGSILKGCRIEGGSSAEDGGVRYKGMVSVHGVDDVRFEACRFGRNYRSDDCVNAVRSRVFLRDCVFLNANADALDLDLSRGAVIHCRFEDAGNDAIDLMGARVAIAGNTIRGSKDKGISVGEGSDPLIADNFIEGCGIGVEVKDRSAPWLVENEIVRNRLGINQKHKNWRYRSGGSARWLSGVLRESRGENLTNDPRSRFFRAVGEDVPQLRDALLASYALSAQPGIGGRKRWSLLPSGSPTSEILFDEDWDSLSDGWTSTGAVRRLEKRGRDLIAHLREGEGSVRLDSLSKGLSRAGVISVEVAGRELESLRMRGRARDGSWHEVELVGDEDWCIGVLPGVKEGWETLELRVRSRSPGGRIILRRVVGFARATTGEGR